MLNFCKTYGIFRLTILTFILTMAIFGIFMLKQGGYSSLIASLDKPAPQYGDFHEYYYPAGKLILMVKKPLGGYFYTPSFAIFLHLFAQFKMQLATNLWGCFQYLCFFMLAIIPGIYIASRYNSIHYYFFYYILALTSFPIFHNLKWGQVSILLTFLIILSYILYEGKKEWLSALSLGLAICIKYYPALFALHFVLKKDYNYIAKLSVICFAIGLVFPASFIGLDKTVEFYKLSFAEMSQATGWVAKDPNSQYFPHVITRIIRASENNTVRGITAVIGLIICFIGFGILRNRIDNTDFETLNFSTLFLFLPFLISTSWPHYFSYLPFCILVCLAEISCSQEPSKSYFLISLLFFASILQSIGFFLVINNSALYAFGGFILFANILTLSVICFIRQDKKITERHKHVFNK